MGQKEPPARILIVEDEAIIAADLAESLMASGYEIAGMASSAEQAFELCAERCPDLVLMDVVLKGQVDGIAAAGALRQRYDLPVVFLTAYSDPTTLGRITQTAPHGYLLKPFRRGELLVMVEMALLKIGAERRIAESERFLGRVLYAIGDGVIATDELGCVRLLNPSAEEITGWSEEEARGEALEKVYPIVEAGGGAGQLPLARRLIGGTAGRGGRRRALLQRRGGERLYIEEEVDPIRDEGGRFLGAVVVFRDLTAVRQLKLALNVSEERFQSAFHQTSLGMALLGAGGALLKVNEALGALLGLPAESTEAQRFQAWVHPEDRGALSTMFDRLNPDTPEVLGGLLTEELRLVTASGQVRWVLLSLSPTPSAAAGPTLLAQVQDITAFRETEERLAYLTRYDPLTGLINRSQLQELTAQAFAFADRHQEEVGLLCLNIDDFKLINDSLGHRAGDILLKAVAERMRSALRASDIVARLGADEFLVAITGVRDGTLLDRVAVKLLSALSRPLVVAGQELEATLSMGIAVYPRDGRDLQLLLARADGALREAKGLGRGGYAHASQERGALALERLQLEQELRRALGRGELALHYQPLLKRGEIWGFEALIRWNHPELGQIPPGRFISIAEETGLILPIGAWVLREAVRQSQAWTREGLRPVRIGVNLSARQFRDPELLNHIFAAIPEGEQVLLDVEITESCLMKDAERTRDILEELRIRGVEISVDDFGTGYSSLAYLKRFPLTRLKIDRSFVKELPNDDLDGAIVQAIVTLAQSLGLEVLAEGVENRQQLECLQRLGCEEFQGFYFARPMEVPLATELLRADRRLP